MKNIIGVSNPYGLVQRAGKNKNTIRTRSKTRMLHNRKKTSKRTRKSYYRKNKNRHI